MILTSKDITPKMLKKIINDITKDRTVVALKKQDRTSQLLPSFVLHRLPIRNWTQFNF